MEDSAHPWREATPELRLRASPLVRRLAAERGIDLGQIEGSGPDGRVVAADIDAQSQSSRAKTAKPAADGDKRNMPRAVRAASPADERLILHRRVDAGALVQLHAILERSHGTLPLAAFAAKALGHALPEAEVLAITSDLETWKRLPRPADAPLTGRIGHDVGHASVALVDLGPLGLDGAEIPHPAGVSLLVTFGAVRTARGRVEVGLSLSAVPRTWSPARAAGILSAVADALERPGVLLAGLPAP